MRQDDFIGQQFYWFTGEVEDIKDPEKMNRVRVRCHGYHGPTDKVATKDLPWATVMMPSTSQSSKGFGRTHELEVGSWVVGFFRDGSSAQDPLVMGSIATKTDDTIDIPVLASGVDNYPNNKVYKSEGGHIIEIDNGTFIPEVPEVPGVRGRPAQPAQVAGQPVVPPETNELNPFEGNFGETDFVADTTQQAVYTESKDAVDAIPPIPAIPAIPAHRDGERIKVTHAGGSWVEIDENGNTMVDTMASGGMISLSGRSNILLYTMGGNISVVNTSGPIHVTSQSDDVNLTAAGKVTLTSAGETIIASQIKTRIM